MPAAEFPRDEDERLETLYDYRILDTMEEERFDAVCRVAASACETPIALISLIDRHRQWFKSVVGLEVRETERECAFCAHAILDDDTLLVEDATCDARFSDNRLVLAKPNIRFYGGEPLHGHDGKRLGTLCVIDSRPRRLTDEQKEALRTLARTVENEMELRRRNVELAELEEKRSRIAQYAVHDLNNPLTAIRMVAESLDEAIEPSSPLRELVDDLGAATGTAQQLVEDLRDIAVARANKLTPRWQPFELEALVRQVVAITRQACRDAGVSLDRELGEVPAPEGDPDLIVRVLQNLVFNAIDHSPAGGRVTIRFERSGDDGYAICVDDEGPGVSPETRERVFDLYSNAPVPGRRSSRGIGLAFCRCAVEAHGGTIGVTDRRPTGSTFRVELPIRRPA